MLLAMALAVGGAAQTGGSGHLIRNVEAVDARVEWESLGVAAVRARLVVTPGMAARLEGLKISRIRLNGLACEAVVKGPAAIELLPEKRVEIGRLEAQCPMARLGLLPAMWKTYVAGVLDIRLAYAATLHTVMQVDQLRITAIGETRGTVEGSIPMKNAKVMLD